MEALRQTWTDLAQDASVRCVTLTGAGRGFCAGADMDLLASDRSDEQRTVDEELSFLPGRALQVPVIVGVNGVCAGGGLHFVADGDIVIASSRASFLDPHVDVGQVTALEPISLLPRVRADQLRRMALLGSMERIDAERAQNIGLVSEVVSDDALLERLAVLATRIASLSPTAVARSRAALRHAEDTLVEASLDRGWDLLRRHWSHPDAQEGPRARAEGREPAWLERIEEN